MSNRYIGGLWVICDDLGDRVDDSLLTGAGTVSLFLSTSLMTAQGSALALISRSSDTIDYLSVATGSKRAGDLERKVLFGPAVPFPRVVRISQALNSMPSRLAHHVAPPLRRAVGVPPATWDALLEVTIRLSGLEDGVVQRLTSVVHARDRQRRISLPDAVDFERDATAVSLEIFRGSSTRQRYLSATPVDGSAPFIRAFEQSGATVIEDRMIDHDMASFPGSSAMRRYLVGAVSVETESGSLTILNANRTKIENTLGVDLIYYHHSFRSFTMVQYKRLVGHPAPVYRPDADSSYANEVQRMRRFLLDSKPATGEDLVSYRLDAKPFFFKFCTSVHDGHWSRMLPGIYMPLELWDLFIASHEARGPRGGLCVGYDNASRRLNNSEFARLVRGGWVGSCGVDSERVNRIVETELASDKSIIAAIHDETRSLDEYLRDTRGRFAAENDPEAL